MTSGSVRCRTAPRIASRASASMARWSPSERHGILRLLAGFEQAQLAALFDAVVHVAPEAQEILRGGNQSANHHEPEQEEPQGVHGGMPRSHDHNRHGTNLQDHLCLTEGRSRNGETLCRSNISQAENRK